MKGTEEEGRWSMWNSCVLVVLLLKVSVSLPPSLPVTKIHVSQLYLCSFWGISIYIFYDVIVFSIYLLLLNTIVMCFKTRLPRMRVVFMDFQQSFSPSNSSSVLHNCPGGSVPSYRVLAAHLHVHAALFTQDALVKHMTDRTSPCE